MTLNNLKRKQAFELMMKLILFTSYVDAFIKLLDYAFIKLLSRTNDLDCLSTLILNCLLSSNFNYWGPLPRSHSPHSSLCLSEPLDKFFTVLVNCSNIFIDYNLNINCMSSRWPVLVAELVYACKEKNNNKTKNELCVNSHNR